uniref:Uncharacterized protein n=1 Tax=Anguilla anguilla TaxID=7936 RepID=A0A0E9P932_ANGAN
MKKVQWILSNKSDSGADHVAIFYIIYNG